MTVTMNGLRGYVCTKLQGIMWNYIKVKEK